MPKGEDLVIGLPRTGGVSPICGGLSPLYEEYHALLSGPMIKALAKRIKGLIKLFQDSKSKFNDFEKKYPNGAFADDDLKRKYFPALSRILSTLIAAESDLDRYTTQLAKGYDELLGKISDADKIYNYLAPKNEITVDEADRLCKAYFTRWVADACCVQLYKKYCDSIDLAQEKAKITRGEKVIRGTFQIDDTVKLSKNDITYLRAIITDYSGVVSESSFEKVLNFERGAKTAVPDTSLAKFAKKQGLKTINLRSLESIIDDGRKLIKSID